MERSLSLEEGVVRLDSDGSMIADLEDRDHVQLHKEIYVTQSPPDIGDEIIVVSNDSTQPPRGFPLAFADNNVDEMWKHEEEILDEVVNFLADGGNCGSKISTLKDIFEGKSTDIVNKETQEEREERRGFAMYLEPTKSKNYLIDGHI